MFVRSLKFVIMFLLRSACIWVYNITINLSIGLHLKHGSYRPQQVLDHFVKLIYKSNPQRKMTELVGCYHSTVCKSWWKYLKRKGVVKKNNFGPTHITNCYWTHWTKILNSDIFFFSYLFIQIPRGKWLNLYFYQEHIGSKFGSSSQFSFHYSNNTWYAYVVPSMSFQTFFL